MGSAVLFSLDLSTVFKPALSKSVRSWPLECGTAFVYGLHRGDGRLFYIGQTVTPMRRLYSHRRTFGLSVSMVILDTASPSDSLSWASHDSERRWLVAAKRAGYALVNRGYPHAIWGVPYHPWLETIEDRMLGVERVKRKSLG